MCPIFLLNFGDPLASILFNLCPSVKKHLFVQLVAQQLFTVLAIFSRGLFFYPTDTTVMSCAYCTLYTKTSRGLNPTLKSGFEKYTMYRTHHHCFSKGRVHLRVISLAYCHSVSVHRQVFNFPWRRALCGDWGPLQLCTTHCVNNANSHVNSIWLLEYFGHFHAPSHHCPCSQNKLKKGCVQYSMLKESSWGREIGRFSIKL